MSDLQKQVSVSVEENAVPTTLAVNEGSYEVNLPAAVESIQFNEYCQLHIDHSLRRVIFNWDNFDGSTPTKPAVVAAMEEWPKLLDRLGRRYDAVVNWKPTQRNMSDILNPAVPEDKKLILSQFQHKYCGRYYLCGGFPTIMRGVSNAGVTLAQAAGFFTGRRAPLVKFFETFEQGIAHLNRRPFETVYEEG